MNAAIMSGLVLVTAATVTRAALAQDQAQETPIALPWDGKTVSFKGMICGCVGATSSGSGNARPRPPV